jgi:tetratricopeptide (TPR) repeat protein
MDAIGGVNEAGWQGKRTKDESDAIDGSAVDKEVDHQDQDAIAVNKIASICSDASRRSLLHRRAIWLQQLDQGSSLAEWIEVFRRAERQCELPYLRDRQELLNLIQLRVSSPAEINGLLSAIKDTKSQNFLRRQLLRRAVSSSLVSAVMSADAINWEMIDATLEKVKDPQARINELRRICEQNPTSAPCTIRLIRALIDTHQVGEALSLATKLREEGKTSPAIMQQIGDLLVEIGKRQDATRAYSEIVEFSAHDPAARQLLGDIYLRHGWFDLAYRQYKTLCEMRAGEPFSLLRLAAAAAGAGRVDEALRLERKVATGEGDPGPSDPRRWARLWSASRIARLMVTAQKEQSKRLSIERNLQRLQLQNAPGLLLLLTWEDLEEHLAINIPNAHFSEKVDAGATGLYALSLPPMPSTTSIQAVINRLANNHTSSYRPRPLKFHLAVIAWDGQHLRANSQDGEIKEAIQNLSIPLPTK